MSKPNPLLKAFAVLERLRSMPLSPEQGEACQELESFLCTVKPVTSPLMAAALADREARLAAELVEPPPPKREVYALVLLQGTLAAGIYPTGQHVRKHVGLADFLIEMCATHPPGTLPRPFDDEADRDPGPARPPYEPDPGTIDQVLRLLRVRGPSSFPAVKDALPDPMAAGYALDHLEKQGIVRREVPAAIFSVVRPPICPFCKQESVGSFPWASGARTCTNCSMVTTLEADLS